MLSTFIFTVGNFVNHCSKLRSVKQTNRFKIFHLDLKLIFFSFPSVEFFSIAENHSHCLKSSKNILIRAFEIESEHFEITDE